MGSTVALCHKNRLDRDSLSAAERIPISCAQVLAYIHRCGTQGLHLFESSRAHNFDLNKVYWGDFFLDLPRLAIRAQYTIYSSPTLIAPAFASLSEIVSREQSRARHPRPLGRPDPSCLQSPPLCPTRSQRCLAAPRQTMRSLLRHESEYQRLVKDVVRVSANVMANNHAADARRPQGEGPHRALLNVVVSTSETNLAIAIYNGWMKSTMKLIGSPRTMGEMICSVAIS